MKLITGLFRFARKRVQTTDTDMGAFRDKIDELVAKKDSLSDEEVESKVEELKTMSADLPESEDKGKLDRFLEDFKSVKEQDEATAKEAAGMVADLFEKLDTEAMQDVGTDTETVEEETTEKESLADGADEVKETAEEVVEETTDPEVKETKDGELSDYTLEEVYQFIKKRMDEDKGTGDSAEEVEEEKEDEEVVTDNAPRISVTMDSGYAAKDSIAAMFAKIKEGGR